VIGVWSPPRLDYVGGDDQTAPSPILCAAAFIQEAERVLLYSRKPRNASLFEGFVAEQTSMGRSSGTDHIWNSRGPICRLLFRRLLVV
jgi:hypothetical protein